MSDYDTFFVVWAPGKGKPTVCHPTFPSAADEAMRLATANPDVAFFVLKAYSKFQTAKPPVQRTDLG